MSARNTLRSTFLSQFQKALKSDEGRNALAEIQAVAGGTERVIFQQDISYQNSPYEDIEPYKAAETRLRSDIVFVTGRFRSGSTLLWNIFRQLEGVTSYYEPFNERQWFNPSRRGDHVDGTHVGVDDYSAEYNELDTLQQFYREDWIRYDLYMDRHSYDYSMQQFIETMIDKAKGRPILQFNRVDFRLDWLKKHFPKAKIVHIYRHPREQFISTLVDPSRFPFDAPVESFKDHFYLNVWVRDLCRVFPFLSEPVLGHPYRRYYTVWKLSYLFGCTYADHGLSLEDLCSKPKEMLEQLFTAVDIPSSDIGKALPLIKNTKTKAAAYADESWFKSHEQVCDQIIYDFLGA